MSLRAALRNKDRNELTHRTSHVDIETKRANLIRSGEYVQDTPGSILLEDFFKENQAPNAAEIELLATATGKTVGEIVAWCKYPKGHEAEQRTCLGLI